jgi:hypothetical protein
MKNTDPASIGSISHLNHEGDTKYTWNRKNDLEVQAAKEHFDSLRAKGFLVFKVKYLGLKKEAVEVFDGNAEKYLYTAPEMVTEFTPEADYVVSPQMSGG